MCFFVSLINPAQITSSSHRETETLPKAGASRAVQTRRVAFGDKLSALQCCSERGVVCGSPGEGRKGGREGSRGSRSRTGPQQDLVPPWVPAEPGEEEQHAERQSRRPHLRPRGGLQKAFPLEGGAGREERGSALGRALPSSLFFPLGMGLEEGGGLKHEGVCTELSRAFLPFSLAVLCCDVFTCSSQRGKEVFGSGEEHPCRCSPLVRGAPLGHQWRLPTESRGSPSPGLARREQESRVWPEAVAGPTQGMFIAHGGQMCCHLLQPCNIRPAAIGKGNQRCLVIHLRTAAEAKNGCLFSPGFFFLPS